MQGLIGALLKVWWVRLSDASCAGKWIGRDFKLWTFETYPTFVVREGPSGGVLVETERFVGSCEGSEF
jgi:hypothetical protein